MAGVVFLGDDFTGASDSLATYARGGWRARLVLDPEHGAAADGLDALGLPTDLRALGPDKARQVVARLWPRIADAAPRVLHFKVCSTFDSSPATGSIGAVARDLAARFAPDVVAVIGGQPSLGRHLAFGNLFARGPDGAVHRIDRHPVMSRHPVTPMTEADMRVHLAAQGLDGLTLVPAAALGDPDAVAATLRAGPVIFDVVTVEDQRGIARALAAAGGRQLLVGASSVAEILTDMSAGAHGPAPVAPPASGAVLLFAGSRSTTTAAQVDAATAYRKLALTPEALAAGTVVPEAAALLRSGGPVLVHLLPGGDYGLSPDALADATSAVVASILAETDVGYLGIAGGDTSSRICAGLGFEALEFEDGLGAGVCVCAAVHRDPRRDRMRVMLKGGQMGTPNLFDRFAARAVAAAPAAS
ncbi:four-carbon acid sugar kinase family protein [Acuticoccus sediminis]|uniref:four-carbon acid sugar kinase family protein n=1 Tax=Acuticoccus sediminis TaxID=2184697 RepID=UPI001CFEB5EF|nr:four-carbon acid sugar kinase family protein [Acuticoccus sediminis]